MRAAINEFDRTCILVEVRHQDPLLRLGVMAALRGDARFELLQAGADSGLFSSTETAPTADVLIADYETGMALVLPGGSPAAAAKVMIVTQRDGEADVQQALARGVLGYVLVGCGLDEFVNGVVALQRGQRYLSQAAVRRVADRLQYQSLSKRETEVMHYIAAGWSNKRVANHLGLTADTVKAHLKGIFGKLGVKTRTEAAHIAQQRGLLPTGDLTGQYRPHPLHRPVAAEGFAALS